MYAIMEINIHHDGSIHHEIDSKTSPSLAAAGLSRLVRTDSSRLRPGGLRGKLCKQRLSDSFRAGNQITGFAPFSVGEAFVFLLIALLLAALIRFFVRMARGRGKRG